MSRLRSSNETIALAHLGAVYLYHQRFGYILEMSRDVHDLWAAFTDEAEPAEVAERFAPVLTGQPPAELIQVLCDFDCLVPTEGSDVEDRALDYVPIKGAWNVWGRINGAVTLWTGWGKRPVSKHALSEQESAVWDAIDGEIRIAELGARFGIELVSKLMLRLASIEVQAIKLSPMPLSVYGGRHKWPSYLTSTMPYPPLETGGGDVPDLTDYHGAIADADAQFDDVETTLAHLFRRPHPALGNRTYGAALLAGLEKNGLALKPEPLRVVEVGGGLGEVAASVIKAASERGYSLNYQILELSPALAEHQRTRTKGLDVDVIVGDALAAPVELGSVDLLIVNEMIGDLEVTPLAKCGDAVLEYDLDVEGAELDTPINTGAFELVKRASEWLAPQGLAVMTEFGERTRYARLSSHLDHPEHSIHFGHLESVATKLGLQTDFHFVIDLIEMERSLTGLATTRSQFRALKGLLADHGVELEKIGYTSEMFAELVGSIGAAGDDFGDVRFDRIEDRLMGLVPHEFKALILVQPSDASNLN